MNNAPDCHKDSDNLPPKCWQLIVSQITSKLCVSMGTSAQVHGRSVHVARNFVGSFVLEVMGLWNEM